MPPTVYFSTADVLSLSVVLSCSFNETCTYKAVLHLDVHSMHPDNRQPHVCKCDPDDMAAPLTSLGDGTFGRDGKKHTAADVELLRHSKRWKERCDPFLKKVIQPEMVIKFAMERWIVDCEDKVDSQGRALFTRKTEKIAMEQTTKVEWVADPQNIEMCRKTPAGKRSSHQLPKWQSNRPESGLEKFHEHLAHLANTGSGKELADALTPGGTADCNVKARWRERVNKKNCWARKSREASNIWRSRDSSIILGSKD